MVSFGVAGAFPASGGFCFRFQRILELLHDLLCRCPRHDLLIPSRRPFHVNMNGRQVLLIAAPRDVGVYLQAAHSSAESDEQNLTAIHVHVKVSPRWDEKIMARAAAKN